jgi:hypothetical protein
MRQLGFVRLPPLSVSWGSSSLARPARLHTILHQHHRPAPEVSLFLLLLQLCNFSTRDFSCASLGGCYLFGASGGPFFVCWLDLSNAKSQKASSRWMKGCSCRSEGEGLRQPLFSRVDKLRDYSRSALHLIAVD